ncbi:putative ste ste11 protein kinase [Lyophyllum shimeji]|uniref:Ste ste11 protein kinase n=1 Tax=Lyophyllum shimeji TaxID=47721 RepID=A0A9P3PIK0_LYOSH|nr:putative ste ste11 protein kinase [Lyophyllum shimeji]
MVTNAVDIVPGVQSKTTRPSSKYLSRIGSLLPFGPSATKPRTSGQPRPAASVQDVRSPTTRSRTKLSTGPGKSVSNKATFQWVKGELLGKGSYANVYLGLNATTGELMAVKQVELPQTPSDLLSSRHREITEALKFERKTLMGLDHRNIVQYLGYDECPGYLSIFLEYVPGGTISSCLQSHGRFSDEVTKSFTHQILQGLEYLHCMGILHRDLKSDNILIEPSGICKISDFGISKQAEDIMQARAFTNMRGTIYWMAPEILDSNKELGYSVKVDIWSVGCIVLEMWTGKRPWFGEEIFPVMMKLWQQKLPPPIPSDLVLSESAADFRRQCFQIDPHDRPSAAELQEHSYLVLPAGWTFDPSEIEPSRLRHSSSQTSRRSRKSVKSHRYLPSSLSGNAKDAPPVPPVPTIVGNSTYRPRAKSHATDIDTARPSLSQRQRSDSAPRPDNGPPLVYITPPNSPPSQSAQLPNNGSRTSLDTSGSVSTPRKGFRIVNPDPDPGTEETPFVYQPPPLPRIDVDSPYSARLSPPIVQGADEAYPSLYLNGSNARTLASPANSTSPGSGPSGWERVSHQSIRRQTKASLKSNGYSLNSDSEGDDEIWAVPPADLTAQGGPSRRRARSSSRSPKGKETTNRISAHDDWARPVPAEVYGNLQEFFPKYDLDQAIIAVSPLDAGSTEGEDRKQRVKKSIRMVAEERNSRAQLGTRRRTKLWDSTVEELRM